MMASTKTKSTGLELTSRDITRVVVVLVGTAIVIAAFLAPWWTRGISIEYNDEENPRQIPGFDQPSLSYGPFSTPGAGGFSADGSREAAVSVLGIGFVLTTGLVTGSLWLRGLARTGRIDVNPDVAVRMTIAAFITGLFTVIWAAFFLPLLGTNPGWLYGQELGSGVLDGVDFVEDVRYANAGFFLGIVGLVMYPAFLWADASASRTAKVLGTAHPATKTTANAY